MSHSPAPQATAYACLRVALRADDAGARARLGAGLVALILTLLLRLLARTEAAWDILPDEETDEFAYAPYALVMPTMGRAPHADCIEAGLVPDWILPGVRNRGMRLSAAPARLRRRARPARAPPPCVMSWSEITPDSGTPTHAPRPSGFIMEAQGLGPSREGARRTRRVRAAPGLPASQA